MCNIWKESDLKRTGGDELDVATLKAVFDGAESLKALDEIVFTGGEPFYKSDFEDFYLFFRKRFPKAKVIISSNGLNTALIIKKIKLLKSNFNLENTTILFSLDGLERIHDQIRGLSGAYNQVMKTLDEAISLDEGLRLGVSFTLLPINLIDIAEVYEFSKQNDLIFTMRSAETSKIYYKNQEMTTGWDSESLEKARIQVERIVQDLSRRRSLVHRKLNPDLYFYSRIIDYIQNPRRLFPCYSSIHSFFLDPYGNVFPCIFSPTKLGNLKEKAFDSLWLSDEANKAREDIKAGKCHCWTECETLSSLQRKFRIYNT